jgi:hypothetical protein
LPRLLFARYADIRRAHSVARGHRLTFDHLLDFATGLVHEHAADIGRVAAPLIDWRKLDRGPFLATLV